MLSQIVRMSQLTWQYRGFISGSVRREFRARYSSSLLGAAWAVISPLAMVIVYLLVFSRLMQARLPGGSGAFDYGIYLCAGIFVWGFFSEIVQRSMTVFSDHAGLIKKINFPRICLPVIVVANATINFAIVFGLFVLVLTIGGHFPGAALLAVIPVTAIVCLFAAAVGIVAGILNVFFRDAAQLFTIVLQFWFWLTPIVYPVSILPQGLAPWVAANPLTPLIAAHQHIALGSGWPNWPSLLAPLLVAVAMAAMALALFRRRAPEIVDEL